MRVTLRETRDHTVKGYLDEALSRGGALSSEVARVLRGQKGRSLLLLPEDCDYIPESFWHGGVVSGTSPIAALAMMLLSEIMLHGRTVLIEHALAKKGDPFLSAIDCRVVFCQESVYFLLDSDTASFTKVEEVIEYAMTAQGFTALIVPSHQLDLDEGEDLRGGDQLSRHVSAAVLGVFDNETFLVWVPQCG